MSELSPFDEPDSLSERRAAASHALASIAKWPHCRHDEAGNVNDFDGEIRSLIDRGRAPVFVWSEFHEQVNKYTWQIFCQTAADAVLLGRDELETELSDARHRLENGVGKPSATDGSKGQWRAALKATIHTYEWLLHGEIES